LETFLASETAPMGLPVLGQAAESQRTEFYGSGLVWKQTVVAVAKPNPRQGDSEQQSAKISHAGIRARGLWLWNLLRALISEACFDFENWILKNALADGWNGFFLNSRGWVQKQWARMT
jgi:hypothetical protein